MLRARLVVFFKIRGLVTFIFLRKNKNKAVTLRSIVFKYPGFTACCWLSVGCGISGTSICFMGFNSLYGYVHVSPSPTKAVAQSMKHQPNQWYSPAFDTCHLNVSQQL